MDPNNVCTIDVWKSYTGIDWPLRRVVWAGKRLPMRAVIGYETPTRYDSRCTREHDWLPARPISVHSVGKGLILEGPHLICANNINSVLNIIFIFHSRMSSETYF